MSGHKPVLLGFAPASVLHRLSFADTLNEDTGKGYQRRFNTQHSLDFRRYIREKSSATIPLTFNLRAPRHSEWTLQARDDDVVELCVPSDDKVLAQVDCQHRLGHLSDLDLDLPFMTFIGLTVADERQIFNVINSKAKGLSTSLLDFNNAQLSADLGAERPELFLALLLHNEPSSPWYGRLDLGGAPTCGVSRRASLRTLQKAIRRFLAITRILEAQSIDSVSKIVLAFWRAVQVVFGREWANPRKHLLTKGIGVYALMELAGDLCREGAAPLVETTFIQALSDIRPHIDWSSEGPMAGLGGERGVKVAVQFLRSARKKSRLRVAHG